MKRLVLVLMLLASSALTGASSYFIIQASPWRLVVSLAKSAPITITISEISDEWFDPRWKIYRAEKESALDTYLIGGRMYQLRDLMGRKL